MYGILYCKWGCFSQDWLYEVFLWTYYISFVYWILLLFIPRLNYILTHTLSAVYSMTSTSTWMTMQCDDVRTWNFFLHHSVEAICRLPVDSHTEGQLKGPLMFSVLPAWISCSTNCCMIWGIMTFMWRPFNESRIRFLQSLVGYQWFQNVCWYYSKWLKERVCLRNIEVESRGWKWMTIQRHLMRLQRSNFWGRCQQLTQKTYSAATTISATPTGKRRERSGSKSMDNWYKLYPSIVL